VQTAVWCVRFRRCWWVDAVNADGGFVVDGHGRDGGVVIYGRCGDC
jgi:hypothetical protein